MASLQELLKICFILAANYKLSAGATTLELQQSITLATSITKSLSYKNLHFYSDCQEENLEELIQMQQVPSLTDRFVHSSCLGGAIPGRIPRPDGPTAAFLAENHNTSSDFHQTILENDHTKELDWYIPDGGATERKISGKLRLDSHVFTYKFHSSRRTAQISEIYGIKDAKFKHSVGWWSETSGLSVAQPQMWERRKDFRGAVLGVTSSPPVAHAIDLLWRAVIDAMAVGINMYSIPRLVQDVPIKKLVLALVPDHFLICTLSISCKIYKIFFFKILGHPVQIFTVPFCTSRSTTTLLWWKSSPPNQRRSSSKRRSFCRSRSSKTCPPAPQTSLAYSWACPHPGPPMLTLASPSWSSRSPSTYSRTSRWRL